VNISEELGKKLGPLPLYVWLLIMSGVGLIFYLFTKGKSTAPTTGTAGTPCTMADGSAGTWDSTGTVCQATTVSTVSASSSAGATSGGIWNYHQRLASRPAGTVGGTATASATTTTSAVPVASVPPSGPPVSGGTGGGGGAATWTFPAPQVKVTGASKTSTQIKISWNAVKGPNGQTPANYTVRIFRGGSQIRNNVVAGTSYTESGLTKGTTGLVINVWANGAPKAPPHGTANT
jgi:hypothetical protein